MCADGTGDNDDEEQSGDDASDAVEDDHGDGGGGRGAKAAVVGVVGIVRLRILAAVSSIWISIVVEAIRDRDPALQGRVLRSAIDHVLQLRRLCGIGHCIDVRIRGFDSAGIAIIRSGTVKQDGSNVDGQGGVEEVRGTNVAWIGRSIAGNVGYKPVCHVDAVAGRRM